MAKSRQNHYSNPFRAVFTGISDLFHKQEKIGELKPEDRLDGKTVLIDGASSGLGFSVAVDLAGRGARIIMACRSGIPEKGEMAKKRSGSNEIYMLKVDYRDIDSIIRLVSDIKSTFSGIDIFVCNAGIVPRNSRITPQGFEEMFMVNYLSKYLVIRLLLKNGCFQRTATPRIIFVSSETHRNPNEFDLNAFGVYQSYSIKKSIELYGYYKLLLTTFAFELSKRLNPPGKVNYLISAICPGPINSNIGREVPLVFYPLMKLVFLLIFKSPRRASLPVVYLAASGDLDEKSFEYLFMMSRKDIDEKASDPGNGKKLWELSEKLLRPFGVELCQ